MLSEHRTTWMPELNGGGGAWIDDQMVGMVRLLNRMGVRTISCCQGEPGEPLCGQSEPEHPAHIMFVDDPGNSYERVAKAAFETLRSLFGDDATFLGVWIDERKRFTGWIRFRNENIPRITERLKDELL